MAMRWSFSSRPGRRACLTALLALSACVTTTSRSWLPSPSNPTYSTATAQPVLAEYVRLQCETLRRAQHPDSGSARFVVDVDTSGTALRAELVRGTPDELLDGVFGTVAAQLKFAPAARPRREPVSITYKCEGEQATVTVDAASR